MTNQYGSHYNFAADYSLPPSKVAELLLTLVEARQPVALWGAPGTGKSSISRQVADAWQALHQSVYALTIDPVDLRGIPWVDEDKRTRWAPPVFLPPTDSPEKHLITLEEVPAAPEMVQKALYELVLDRRCGEYRLPEGAALVACGNSETDRAGVYRLPTPLANRFIHVDLTVSLSDWAAWAVTNDIDPRVIFFLQFRPELLHQFNPQSREYAFASPRSWEFVSKALQASGDRDIDPDIERAMFRGAVGEAAATEFTAFLRVWKELPHPRTVIDDPHNAPVPENMSALLALCGSVYRIADEFNMDSVVKYAQRLTPEINEFLVGSCTRRNPELRNTQAWVIWNALQTAPNP